MALETLYGRIGSYQNLMNNGPSVVPSILALITYERINKRIREI
jgi:hypothetical protein